jgi:hypothetical protein
MREKKGGLLYRIEQHYTTTTPYIYHYYSMYYTG